MGLAFLTGNSNNVPLLMLLNNWVQELKSGIAAAIHFVIEATQEG
ncbi:hypothetical protein QFZ31_000470 [Neobacillus niacini]|nr:hypothetical protein [Neobacillus niacini]MDQ0970592.1 hypothetical protein [Neobacillus niacini]